ncbi:hypothetical protein AAG747_14030 [Rapidithrix thailandica]|uniref:Uncharacterized protein n=1 Tax=Rapidithrix thailandica TaxID=413964 RepID=A0AAW9S5A4_9BACT
MQFGIENLKKILLAVFVLIYTLFEIFESKFKWMKLLKLLNVVKEIPRVVASAPFIDQELDDLSTEEHKELIGFIAERFELDNDKSEEAIEAALMWMVATGNAVEKFKELGVFSKKKKHKAVHVSG